MSKDLEYNSERDILVIPEYGRNIQKLIDYAKTIESDAMRQRFIEKVIDLMQQMNPQSGNLDEYREKLWRHVFRIANFELEGVTPPNGKIPKPEEAKLKPDPVEYPESTAKFRHYGSNVQHLIKKAIEMEEGPKRDGFIRVIGSYMKLAYRTWNKEHYVSDEIIKNDLKSLSNGKLTLDEDTSIDQLTQSSRHRGSSGRSSSRRSNNGKSYRSKGGGRSKRK